MTESEGLPLLVEDDWGKGQDHLPRARRGTAAVVDVERPAEVSAESVDAGAAAENPSLRPQWNEAIFSQVLLSPSFVSTYVPSRSLLFAIAGYLAGIVVLARLWQRRRMTRRTLALACCGWILCAAAAGYLFFSRGGKSPDGVLLAATVMENAGDGYVEAQSNLALFSTQTPRV